MLKKILLISVLLYQYSFANKNVDLLGQFKQSSPTRYSDIWGYADNKGNEYALIGVNGAKDFQSGEIITRGGTLIIDVTNPAEPVEAAFIPGPPSIWREIKTHDHYAYVVTEGRDSGRGLQIIDLSQLPDTAVLVNTVDEYFISAHNIFIDNGYAFAVGTNDGGGMRILDLSDPVNPVQTAYYTESGYIHDVYVWNDTVVICAGNSQSYHLVDVSDKTNPKKISESPKLPGIYAHSGWMTEDKRYFVAAEEFNQRDVMVWDISDRTAWDLKVPTWQMPTTSTVHNLYVKGNYAHISYYGDGYVVLDISNPEDPVFAGQYDVTANVEGYTGAWGCYPYLPSGNILISSMEDGLFILKFSPSEPTGVAGLKSFTYSLEQNYPNPFNPNTNFTFRIAESGRVILKIYDLLGNEVATVLDDEKSPGEYHINFDANKLASGVYYYTLKTNNFISTKKMILLR